MRECSGRSWGLSHSPSRAGYVIAPHRIFDTSRRRRHGACASRMSQTPACHNRSLSEPLALMTAHPATQTDPSTAPGRRGRRDVMRAAGLPTINPHSPRALFLVAPQTHPTCRCEFVEPRTQSPDRSRSRFRSPAPAPRPGPFTNQGCRRPPSRARGTLLAVTKLKCFRTMGIVILSPHSVSRSEHSVSAPHRTASRSPAPRSPASRRPALRRLGQAERARS